MKKLPNGEWRAFLENASRATTDACLVGRGKTRPNYKVGDKNIRASRYVWTLAHGDPGRSYVLHTCDNELCVNIRHMYLGTQAQNVIDMISRGRQAPPERTAHPGSKNGRAKLTEEDVVQIRKRYGDQKRARRGSVNSLRLIAIEYGVGQSTICRVVRGIGWGHVA